MFHGFAKLLLLLFSSLSRLWLVKLCIIHIIHEYVCIIRLPSMRLLVAIILYYGVIILTRHSRHQSASVMSVSKPLIVYIIIGIYIIT